MSVINAETFQCFQHQIRSANERSRALRLSDGFYLATFITSLFLKTEKDLASAAKQHRNVVERLVN